MITLDIWPRYVPRFHRPLAHLGFGGRGAGVAAAPALGREGGVSRMGWLAVGVVPDSSAGSTPVLRHCTTAPLPDCRGRNRRRDAWHRKRRRGRRLRRDPPAGAAAGPTRSRQARRGIPWDLHLVVDAPEELEGAVGEASAQVAGAIDTCARALRMCDETLRRQAWPTDVASSQALTADGDLAVSAVGHDLTGLVDQHDLGARNRYANWRQGRPFGRPAAQPVCGHEHAPGGPVLVPQRASRA